MVFEANSTIIKKMEIPEATICLRSDRIVYVAYKENVTLDVKLQTHMLDLFREITGNQKTNFIFETDEGFVVTKEARENAANLEKDTPVKASAMIVTNLATRLIANFFIKVNKPTLKYKLFGNHKDAIEWLNSL
jgi:hypothetical protein